MVKNIVRACTALVVMVFVAVMGIVGFAFADTDADSSEGTATVSEEAGFGLSGFQRMQVGSNKKQDGQSIGYCYAWGTGTSDNGCAIALSDRVVVYLPSDAVEKAGFDLENANQVALFQTMLQDLDSGLANGGTSLEKAELPYEYTTDSVYRVGDVAISFGIELEEDHYYTLVKKEGSDSSRGISTFCDTFKLLPADQVAMPEELGVFGSLKAFLGKIDYRPLWVSIKTALVALIFIFILGLIAAWRSMHVKSRLKSLLDSIFTIPMVMPPTVCGFLLLLVFGKSTALGRFFIDHGLDLVFTWPAAVIAAVVVGFPLMYRTVLGAFEALDVNMLDAARTLGWSEVRIFGRLMLPLAWPSIAAGMVLAFARAMGEFGATLFFAGNVAGVTQTMPIAIYFSWMGGATDVAVFWVVMVILISFLIILVINLYSAHVQKFRATGATGVDEDMGFGDELPAAFDVRREGEEKR